MLKIIATFCYSKELVRAATKFSLAFKPLAIYAKLFTVKLSLACLFIGLIELLKFKFASSAKWCTLEYFIARIDH